MLLATCVNTPIDHNVFQNLRTPVARCSASCVNWACSESSKMPVKSACQHPQTPTTKGTPPPLMCLSPCTSAPPPAPVIPNDQNLDLRGPLKNCLEINYPTYSSLPPGQNLDLHFVKSIGQSPCRWTVPACTAVHHQTPWPKYIYLDLRNPLWLGDEQNTMH